MAQKFQFSGLDLIRFHKCFRRLDKSGSGYIGIESLYKLLDEEPSSVMTPYIERFFSLIKREHNDKVNFNEWLPATAVFCLYTYEQVLQFVFFMIDTDQDEFISKKDIVEFLTQKIAGSGKKCLF